MCNCMAKMAAQRLSLLLHEAYRFTQSHKHKVKGYGRFDMAIKSNQTITGELSKQYKFYNNITQHFQGFTFSKEMLRQAAQLPRCSWLTENLQ